MGITVDLCSVGDDVVLHGSIKCRLGGCDDSYRLFKEVLRLCHSYCRWDYAVHDEKAYF